MKEEIHRKKAPAVGSLIDDQAHACFAETIKKFAGIYTVASLQP